MRLPAVHERGVARAARARRHRGSLPHVHAAPRARPATQAGDDRSAPARACRSRPEELEAMFAESRPEVIEDMRQAADELREELAGDLVTFVVNRNINVSNVCTVGCAFCGFGVAQALARRLRALARGLRAPRARRGRVRRDRDLHAVGHPPRLGAGGLPRLAAAGQGDRAGHPPARVQPDGGRAHVRRLAGCRRTTVFEQLREAGPRQRPRHRRRGAARRRAPAHQPEQAAGRRAGWRSSPPPTRSACARR